MIIKVSLLLLGIVVLLTGAEFLVRASRSIAMRFGVSTLVIGLTIVAFGTSAPELFVSVAAALDGTADVAVGNILGSNLFNIFVIIGITAIFVPIRVASSIVKRELPLMLVVLGLMTLFASDGNISRYEGGFLVTGLLAYLFINYLEVTSAEREVIEEFGEALEEKEKDEPMWKAGVGVVAGLIGLMIGAQLIVDNAVWCARQFGISELIIGVTLVAVGTSLPELATTALAARKGEPDLVVGNAVGSNIFNVLCVVGITALIHPLAVVDSAIRFDLPFMFFSAVPLLPILYISQTIGRWLGAGMLAVYVGYIWFGVLA